MPDELVRRRRRAEAESSGGAVACAACAATSAGPPNSRRHREVSSLPARDVTSRESAERVRSRAMARASQAMSEDAVSGSMMNLSLCEALASAAFFRKGRSGANALEAMPPNNQGPYATSPRLHTSQAGVLVARHTYSYSTKNSDPTLRRAPPLHALLQSTARLGRARRQAAPSHTCPTRAR